MIRNYLLLLIGILCVATVVVAEKPVAIGTRFVCNTKKIVPGDAIEIGVEFTIPTGWHLYYQNPGETGLPTRVDIAASAGVAVGDMIWPVPERFVTAGDVVGYGYSDSLLLKFPVQIGEEVRHGSEVAFSASAHWLACSHDLCVPGEATLKKTFLIGQLKSAVGNEVFTVWQDRFPKNFSNISALKNISVETEKRQDQIELQVVLQWNERGSDPLWIPDGVDSLLFAEQELTTEGEVDTLSIQARPMPGSGFSTGVIKGILTFKTIDGQLVGTPVRFTQR